MPIRSVVPGRRYKPADVRFYFGADVLGLAHQIAGLRPDATYPGDPGGIVLKRLRAPCPITSPAVKDRIWIPQVTALGWLIITRDARIQEHTAEIGAVRESGARMVLLHYSPGLSKGNRSETQSDGFALPALSGPINR